jgi:hypothetical protein
MKWTQDQAIAYESACECISALIAIHTAAITHEQRAEHPSASVIAELDEQITQLFRERKSLLPTDDEAVKRIRIEYGGLVRAAKSVDHLSSVHV